MDQSPWVELGSEDPCPMFGERRIGFYIVLLASCREQLGGLPSCNSHPGKNINELNGINMYQYLSMPKNNDRRVRTTSRTLPTTTVTCTSMHLPHVSTMEGQP